MESFALSEEALRRRRGVKWRRYPEGVLPAWVADMDFLVAGPVDAAVRRVVDHGDYGYPGRAEEDAVEPAFADRMRERHGWSIDAAGVQVVSDLVQAIIASIVAYSGPGDGVVVQTPIYPPFLRAIETTRRRRVANPLRDDGTRFVLDAAGLESGVDDRTRMLLVCNPHNPTGRVFERHELEALGRLAVDRDLVIVCDEIHADLVYSGHRHLPIASLAPEIAARTVTLASATKGFNIAGLRCGVMHFGSPALMARFQDAIPAGMLGHASGIGADATVAAWRHGQPWLDGVLRQLEVNRDRVGAWAAGIDGLRHRPPEATYLAWLDWSAFDLPGACAQEFFLERARVGLSPGQDFDRGAGNCVRLNFATAPDILDRVLSRMSRSLEGLALGA